jgi:hypothetical protein
LLVRKKLWLLYGSLFVLACLCLKLAAWSKILEFYSNIVSGFLIFLFVSLSCVAAMPFVVAQARFGRLLCEFPSDNEMYIGIGLSGRISKKLLYLLKISNAPPPTKSCELHNNNCAYFAKRKSSEYCRVYIKRAICGFNGCNGEVYVGTTNSRREYNQKNRNSQDIQPSLSRTQFAVCEHEPDLHEYVVDTNDIGYGQSIKKY